MPAHDKNHTHPGTYNITQDHNADMQYIATQTPRLLYLAQAKLRTVQASPSRRDTATLHKSILLLNTIFSAEDAAAAEREREEVWYDRMTDHMKGDENEDEMEELEGWDEEMSVETMASEDSRVEVVEVEASESDEEEEEEGYDLSDDEDQHMEYSFASVSSDNTLPTPLTYSTPSLIHTSADHHHHVYSPTPTKGTLSFYDDNDNFAFSDPLDPFVSDDDEDDDELITPPQALHDSFGDEDDGDFGGMADEEREALEGLQLFSMRAC